MTSPEVPECSPPAARTHALPASIIGREDLRNKLSDTVDALRRRRADLVPEDLIAAYVAIDWLEWHGGALRLTPTGTNICDQLRSGRVDLGVAKVAAADSARTPHVSARPS